MATFITTKNQIWKSKFLSTIISIYSENGKVVKFISKKL